MSLSSSLSSVSPRHLRLSLLPWLFLLCENALLSEFRPAVASALGSDDLYLYLYAWGSTMASGAVLYGYCMVRGRGPFLVVTPARRAAGALLQAAGLVGFSQLAPPLRAPFEAVTEAPSLSAGVTGPPLALRCPFDFSPPTASAPAPTGIARVSRNAPLYSLASLSLGSALLSPSLPAALCLSGPLLIAAAGGAHRDSRLRRGIGGSFPPGFEARTSSVPFLAMLEGRQGGGAFGRLGEEGRGWNAALAAAVAGGLALRRGRAKAASW
ncbi:hypothetical protein TeGR_g3173 [Tetraparma gracilis]|uniref:Uncharacterized protein n=1 Tax=Tetraparma gracilis TaxID=2962635 RepID=A0ABQ6MQB2_9STRA|nr:hypothetical protein TeGR_g3173 [Tetraparma gracilis]